MKIPDLRWGQLFARVVRRKPKNTKKPVFRKSGANLHSFGFSTTFGGGRPTPDPLFDPVFDHLFAPNIAIFGLNRSKKGSRNDPKNDPFLDPFLDPLRGWPTPWI